MPSSATVISKRDAFLSAVQASGLLNGVQFAKATAALPPDLNSASAIAHTLTAAGFLTRFQAERLLAGRTDGFVIGQYAILEQVGRGAMGRVYKAKHRTMNRHVAIKVLSADVTRTPAARETFQREVRAAASLNHPNIVTAYDANEVGDRSYLVLEFVDGPNLDALVKQRGSLPVTEVCEIVRQAALGLQHAHEHGMVHRDIKPANLLIARPSKTVPGCLVKIADFGIARLQPPPANGATPSTAPVAGLLGTPDFIAPEQAQDPRRADHRADLYSLGCVFHFLLTGRPPFPGGSVSEKVARHQSEPPTPIQQLRHDVPAAVAEIVHRLMAKEPNARHQSAAEVAARLESLAVALGDAAGTVSYDLPAPQAGPYSFASGYLSGFHTTPGADTSPWAQLTDDSAQCATLTPDLELTPLATQSGRRKTTWKPKRGLSKGTVLAICLGVVAACAVIGAAFVKAVVK